MAAAALGIGLELVLAASIGLRAAAPAEQLALRWLRSVVDHPSRTALALGLAFWAILPARATARSASPSAARRADAERDAGQPKSL